MADSNFFKKNGNFRLGYLSEISSSKLANPSDSELLITDVSSLDNAGPGEISFLQNPKYVESFKTTKASACILHPKHIEFAPKGLALLVSDNPYYSYARIAEKFYHKDNFSVSVSDLSYVDNSATVGNRTVIHAGVYIGPNCIVGRNCTIHSGVSISHAIIGENVIIHSGTRIGQDGFGYAFHQGRHFKVPQLGRVIIENDVEIGANTTIDRGAGPDTVIGEGSKIDNLVQIGHNCKIGKHCIIVSQVGISGSTEIGDYTSIGGQAGIAGHLKIGSKVSIAAKSGVFSDIEDGAVVGGFPAVPIKQFHRQSVALKKLAERKHKDPEGDKND